MFKSNCHTHSTYCDGKNTLEEMVIGAIDKGFSCIGFSGHSPMNFENDWAMTEENCKKYIADVLTLKEKYKNKIDILLGIELDADCTDTDLDKLDYIICAVHQFLRDGKEYPIDYSPEALTLLVNELFEGDWLKMCRAYYDRLCDFTEKMKPQVVAHLDLITKYNEKSRLFDEADPEYRKTVFSAVDRIMESDKNVLFEVNTGAMYRVGNKKPYPAQFIMQYLARKGAKLTVSSDSHCIESLDFAFDEAFDYCRKNGFDRVYALSKSGVKEIIL